MPSSRSSGSRASPPPKPPVAGGEVLTVEAVPTLDEVYPNGDHYVGLAATMADACGRTGQRKQGLGTYTFVNGSQYVGEWRCGVMHGKGRFVDASSGDVFDGLWRHGRRWMGACRYGNGNEYQGRFVTAKNGQCCKHGPAIIRVRGTWYAVTYDCDTLVDSEMLDVASAMRRVDDLNRIIAANCSRSPTPVATACLARGESTKKAVPPAEAAHDANTTTAASSQRLAWCGSSEAEFHPARLPSFRSELKSPSPATGSGHSAAESCGPSDESGHRATHKRQQTSPPPKTKKHEDPNERERREKAAGVEERGDDATAVAAAAASTLLRIHPGSGASSTVALQSQLAAAKQYLAQKRRCGTSQSKQERRPAAGSLLLNYAMKGSEWMTVPNGLLKHALRYYAEPATTVQ